MPIWEYGDSRGVDCSDWPDQYVISYFGRVLGGACTGGSEISIHQAKRLAALDRVSWDSLRILLVLSEAGSFRAASEFAGASLNTIRGKIERLETQFGAPLVKRSVEGVVLTQDGYELVSIARRMRMLGHSTERVQPEAQLRQANRVKVVAREGFASICLLPSLTQLAIANPDLHLDVQCEAQICDVLFRDVDLAVQLEPPVNPELIVTKIGALHLLPFASKSYLDQHGTPQGADDLSAHRVVWQEEGYVAPELLSLLLESDSIDELVSVKTNSSSAHFQAVGGGAGIGFLPSFGHLLNPSIQWLDIGVRLRRDIYLVSHPQSSSRSKVDLVSNCIRDAIDPMRHPWFCDEFVHPNEFKDSGIKLDAGAISMSR